MRTLVLLLVLAACGGKKVSSFERGGYKFAVPSGWSAEVSDVAVTLRPDKSLGEGVHIIVMKMVPPEAISEYKKATAEWCGQSFKSVDAIKPPGQLVERGELRGCVHDLG